MRRLLTFVGVAALTAAGALHWLHDGDLMAAIQPVMAEWDADLLARNAGIGSSTGEAPEDTLQDAASD